ncbi:unnamed protein product [Caenorhabditis angaria]|uniref:RING-type E3 ubiquitin transferase n=1 Tax=Caenorhabditis angaria TaxID=860376 RepID=A0A9P1NCE9_9PELO|nr:unnamed protein product [Caenorhabditis angaria]
MEPGSSNEPSSSSSTRRRIRDYDSKPSKPISRVNMLPEDELRELEEVLTNSTRQEGKELKLNMYDRQRQRMPVFKTQPVVEVDMKQIIPNLSCDVCHDLVTSSVMTKKCGHRFCDQCIMICIMRAGSSCPTCRQNLASKRELKQDPRFDKFIVQLVDQRSDAPRFMAKPGVETEGYSDEPDSDEERRYLEEDSEMDDENEEEDGEREEDEEYEGEDEEENDDGSGEEDEQEQEQEQEESEAGEEGDIEDDDDEGKMEIDEGDDNVGTSNNGDIVEKIKEREGSQSASVVSSEHFTTGDEQSTRDTSPENVVIANLEFLAVHRLPCPDSDNETEIYYSSTPESEAEDEPASGSGTDSEEAGSENDLEDGEIDENEEENAGSAESGSEDDEEESDESDVNSEDIEIRVSDYEFTESDQSAWSDDEIIVLQNDQPGIASEYSDSSASTSEYETDDEDEEEEENCEVEGEAVDGEEVESETAIGEESGEDVSDEEEEEEEENQSDDCSADDEEEDSEEDSEENSSEESDDEEDGGESVESFPSVVYDTVIADEDFIDDTRLIKCLARNMRKERYDKLLEQECLYEKRRLEELMESDSDCDDDEDGTENGEGEEPTGSLMNGVIGGLSTIPEEIMEERSLSRSPFALQICEDEDDLGPQDSGETEVARPGRMKTKTPEDVATKNEQNETERPSRSKTKTPEEVKVEENVPDVDRPGRKKTKTPEEIAQGIQNRVIARAKRSNTNTPETIIQSVEQSEPVVPARTRPSRSKTTTPEGLQQPVQERPSSSGVGRPRRSKTNTPDVYQQQFDDSQVGRPTRSKTKTPEEITQKVEELEEILPERRRSLRSNTRTPDVISRSSSVVKTELRSNDVSEYEEDEEGSTEESSSEDEERKKFIEELLNNSDISDSELKIKRNGEDLEEDDKLDAEELLYQQTVQLLEKCQNGKPSADAVLHLLSKDYEVEKDMEVGKSAEDLELEQILSEPFETVVEDNEYLVGKNYNMIERLIVEVAGMMRMQTMIDAEALEHPETFMEEQAPNNIFDPNFNAIEQIDKIDLGQLDTRPPSTKTTDVPVIEKNEETPNENMEVTNSDMPKLSEENIKENEESQVPIEDGILKQEPVLEEGETSKMEVDTPNETVEQNNVEEAADVLEKEENKEDDKEIEADADPEIEYNEDDIEEIYEEDYESDEYEESDNDEIIDEHAGSTSDSDSESDASVPDPDEEPPLEMPEFSQALLDNYKKYKKNRERQRYKDRVKMTKMANIRLRNVAYRPTKFAHPHLPARAYQSGPSSSERPKKIAKMSGNVQMSIVQPPFPLHQLQYNMKTPSKITAVPNVHPNQEYIQKYRQQQYMLQQQAALQKQMQNQQKMSIEQQRAQNNVTDWLKSPELIAQNLNRGTEMCTQLFNSLRVPQQQVPPPTTLQQQHQLQALQQQQQLQLQQLNQQHQLQKQQMQQLPYSQQQRILQQQQMQQQQLQQQNQQQLQQYHYQMQQRQLQHPGIAPTPQPMHAVYPQQPVNPYAIVQQPGMYPPQATPQQTQQQFIHLQKHPQPPQNPQHQQQLPPQMFWQAQNQQRYQQQQQQHIQQQQQIQQQQRMQIQNQQIIDLHAKVLELEPHQRALLGPGVLQQIQQEHDKIKFKKVDTEIEFGRTHTIELQLWPTNGYQEKKRSLGRNAETVFCKTEGQSTFSHVAELLHCRLPGQQQNAQLGSFWVFKKDDNQVRRFTPKQTLLDAQRFVGQPHLVIFYDEASRADETNAEYIINSEYLDNKKP